MIIIKLSFLHTPAFWGFFPRKYATWPLGRKEVLRSPMIFMCFPSGPAPCRCRMRCSSLEGRPRRLFQPLGLTLRAHLSGFLVLDLSSLPQKASRERGPLYTGQRSEEEEAQGAWAWAFMGLSPNLAA